MSLERITEGAPKFDVPPEHTTDTYFEHVARQGFEQRRERLAALDNLGALKHPLAVIFRASGSRDPRDSAGEVLGIFPDGLGISCALRNRVESRWVPGEALLRAAWSATRCRSPTSIRCRMVCCLSDF